MKRTFVLGIFNIALVAALGACESTDDGSGGTGAIGFSGAGAGTGGAPVGGSIGPSGGTSGLAGTTAGSGPGTTAGGAPAGGAGIGGSSGGVAPTGGAGGAVGGSGGAVGGAGGATGGAGGAPGGTPKVAVKPRVIATTDGELDDTSSMNRFLIYASDYDVAGIVQVNSRFQKGGHSKDKWIEAQIAEYAKCLPNLRKHRPDYPDAEYLLSVLKAGNENAGDLGNPPPTLSHSEGAQLIIDALLDEDPRPVHILAWGGANTQANALWQIKEKHSAADYQKAAEKARLYCIWFQDVGGEWIVDNLPEIKIYGAGRPSENASWRYVWDYMSVAGKYKGRGSENPPELQEIMDTPWLNENVKTGHGPLGAAYTQDYTSEGDTPSFMPLIDNGLEHHLDYTLGGWGGRAVYASGNYMEDGADENESGETDAHWTFQRWLRAAQNDWASRNDWCVAERFEDANHQPDARVAGELISTVAGGSTVTLDASPTTDPDGDVLTFKWWQYHEADSADAKITITNPDAQTGASFAVPNESGKQVHVILEVIDNGSPPLTRYQRLIFNIN